MIIKKMMSLFLLIFIAAAFYYHWNNAIGISAGLTWGLMNVYCIKQLIYRLLIAEQRHYLKIVIFALIKFPLLYLVGYGLLLIKDFSPWDLLIGFSIALIVMTQSWFWNKLNIDANMDARIRLYTSDNSL